MKFSPQYVITDHLLEQIKRVNTLINELNSQRFPHLILLELEKSAREISTFTSTSIEGNPLPLTDVRKILKSRPSHIRNSEKEVLNYNQALKNLNNLLKEKNLKLSLGLILKIQKQVTAGLLPAFETGRLREKPVAVHDPRTGKVVYLPPDAKDVAPLLENLLNFVNVNKKIIDPLILAGIFHKQMVIIHPFMDGNGRTTRLATKVLLAEMGLNTFNLFSFENYYNSNVTRYFQTVGEYGDYYELANLPAGRQGKINFTSWLEYFAEGIIDELLRVQKLLQKTTFNPQTQLQVYHLKMLKFIREKGFITDREYRRLTPRAKATRTQDFNKLISLNLIERKGKGKATYYILTEE